MNVVVYITLQTCKMKDKISKHKLCKLKFAKLFIQTVPLTVLSLRRAPSSAIGFRHPGEDIPILKENIFATNFIARALQAHKSGAVNVPLALCSILFMFAAATVICCSHPKNLQQKVLP